MKTGIIKRKRGSAIRKKTPAEWKEKRNRSQLGSTHSKRVSLN